MARSHATRTATAGLLVTGLLLALSASAHAAAQPPGNKNWITLEGTCNDQPATLIDPKGGNTAFTVGGSVGIGKTFTFTDIATGTVIEQTVTGKGIDPSRLFTCEFVFPTDSGDVLFTVQGINTPQGHH